MSELIKHKDEEKTINPLHGIKNDFDDKCMYVSHFNRSGYRGPKKGKDHLTRLRVVKPRSLSLFGYFLRFKGHNVHKPKTTEKEPISILMIPDTVQRA